MSTRCSYLRNRALRFYLRFLRESLWIEEEDQRFRHDFRFCTCRSNCLRAPKTSSEVAQKLVLSQLSQKHRSIISVYLLCFYFMPIQYSPPPHFAAILIVWTLAWIQSAYFPLVARTFPLPCQGLEHRGLLAWLILLKFVVLLISWPSNPP